MALYDVDVPIFPQRPRKLGLEVDRLRKKGGAPMVKLLRSYWMPICMILLMVLMFVAMIDGHRLMVKKAEVFAAEAKAMLPEQAKMVQDAVEHWARTNADMRYPSSLNDINDAGQTVIDLLPDQRRFVNVFNRGMLYQYCTEPRNWSSSTKDDDVIVGEAGAIYYCPSPDGGYFIRAYTATDVCSLILTSKH